MKTSSLVMLGLVGLAATPVAFHLVAGTTGASPSSLVKMLHGSAASALHGGSSSGHTSTATSPHADAAAGDGTAAASPGQQPAPAPSRSELSGTWIVTIQTGDDAVGATMTLAQKDQKLTGTLSNPHGDGDLPVVGEFARGAVTLSVDAVVEHGEMHIGFKGTMREDGSLAGTVTSALGEGKWTAKRK